MSISIDSAACIGCAACVRACPGNLLKLGADGRAYSRRPRDCWGCTACLKECPSGAISYFLGADMGGRGTRLAARREGASTTWVFTRPDGAEQRIVVDGSQANRY